MDLPREGRCIVAREGRNRVKLLEWHENARSDRSSVAHANLAYGGVLYVFCIHLWVERTMIWVLWLESRHRSGSWPWKMLLVWFLGLWSELTAALVRLILLRLRFPLWNQVYLFKVWYERLVSILSLSSAPISNRFCFSEHLLLRLFWVRG